ncbi:preprotein translocase subunit SecE [Pelovirga terrestris]|uniref:Protein translocase subunit SecE n=1 Tax=Pelovirga terrestris TaxID=2771352 RepID=A0A8J6UGR5_9BACT|nr:preprotein translocase subunit SecE [Pelovirga terrestris]MBD1400243.1 preprotein translocase subunit SecE [Pelovirga terrestris]
MTGKLNTFLGNVKEELQKVTWPSKKDTYGSTMVVIIVVMFCAVYLGVVDMILSRLIQVVLG